MFKTQIFKTQIRKILIASGFLIGLAMAPVAQAETTGQYIDDATITAKVKAALIADKEVKGMNINVETDRGNVLLTGKVGSKAQEDKAVSLAHKVDGVKSVNDRLEIKNGNTQNKP